MRITYPKEKKMIVYCVNCIKLWDAKSNVIAIKQRYATQAKKRRLTGRVFIMLKALRAMHKHKKTKTYEKSIVSKFV